MKLSKYAERAGVTYKTAWRWWKAGDLSGYQLSSGTIIISEAPDSEGSLALEREMKVALYARVSGSGQRADGERQLERLRDFAAARGYRVEAEVLEVASGLNDKRPKLARLLADTSIAVIVVEHGDRLTRFGLGYISTLLGSQGRRVEAVFPTDTGDDLMDDFAAVITSMCARIYGRRNARRRAERIKQCIKADEDSPTVEAAGS